MPRQNHRLIREKDRDALKLLIEKLFVHVSDRGGLTKFAPVDKQLLENLFSFYRRIKELTQEEVNIVWETAKMMIEQELGDDADDVVDEEKRTRSKAEKKVLLGNYWIFPGQPGTTRQRNPRRSGNRTRSSCALLTSSFPEHLIMVFVE